ncbi:hypothetical protein N7495_001337 [Penicillium taxi]|uniref:uncharacterized protein n=1 Tax=Penicillium taxi TaxID=168475 RepID=UPI002544DD67|nr:uncharacterized protein N7495_001337 [Penicillium taxi]KAJ5908655.1 hypothetical protein N7495_001337 [Penicillium taxi]
MKWAVMTPDGNEYALAILEYKNSHTINAKDFETAKAETEEEADEMEARAYDNDDGEITLLSNNAVILGKQCAKYGKSAKRVGLFDYLSLFLWEFKADDVDGYQYDRGFLFSETGEGGNMTFRKLLFAWIADAVEEWKASNLLDERAIVNI